MQNLNAIHWLMNENTDIEWGYSCDGVDYQQGDHYFPWHRTEIYVDTIAPNYKMYHDVDLLDKYRLFVRYGDNHVRVRRLRGQRMLLASIRYWYIGPASSVIVKAAIEYKKRTSLISVYGNLNADRYISDLLHSVVVL